MLLFSIFQGLLDCPFSREWSSQEKFQKSQPDHLEKRFTLLHFSPAEKWQARQWPPSGQNPDITIGIRFDFWIISQLQWVIPPTQYHIVENWPFTMNLIILNSFEVYDNDLSKLHQY